MVASVRRYNEQRLEARREWHANHCGQAELTGDTELARSAYHMAFGHGVQSVVDTHLSSRPTESKAWEAYTTAHEEANQSKGIDGLLGRAFAERAFGQS